MRNDGFTLVELLVVITIIAVLLAVLTPALDKAVYQAELAVCGAQQKAIVLSATTAAMDYKRRYFDRPPSYTPHMVSFKNGPDRRPQFRAYLGGLDERLLCPFNEAVDLERSLAFSMTYGNCWTFFGAVYSGRDGGPGMTRLGKPWTYDAREYDVMTSDYYVQASNGSVQWSTHPDSKGVLPPVRLQDSGVPTALTYSGWAGGGDPGTVDLNTGYSDGSVLPLRDVRALDLIGGVKDERVEVVNNVFNTNNATQYGMIARRSR